MVTGNSRFTLLKTTWCQVQNIKNANDKMYVNQDQYEAMRQTLAAKYPKIFPDGAWVGERGWYYIIDNLCSLIQNHVNHSRRVRARALYHNRALKSALAGDDTSLRMWVGNIETRPRRDDKRPLDVKWAEWVDTQVAKKIAAAKETGYSEPVPEAIEQVAVTEIKEKFGSMRFYYNGGDSVIEGFVSMAEAMSATTCGNCGAVGRIGGSGWLTCRCMPCSLGFTQLVPFDLEQK